MIEARKQAAREKAEAVADVEDIAQKRQDALQKEASNERDAALKSLRKEHAAAARRLGEGLQRNLQVSDAENAASPTTASRLIGAPAPVEPSNGPVARAEPGQTGPGGNCVHGYCGDGRCVCMAGLYTGPRCDVEYCPKCTHTCPK